MESLRSLCGALRAVSSVHSKSGRLSSHRLQRIFRHRLEGKLNHSIVDMSRSTQRSIFVARPSEGSQPGGFLQVHLSRQLRLSLHQPIIVACDGGARVHRLDKVFARLAERLQYSSQFHVVDSSPRASRRSAEASGVTYESRAKLSRRHGGDVRPLHHRRIHRAENLSANQ